MHGTYSDQRIPLMTAYSFRLKDAINFLISWNISLVSLWNGCVHEEKKVYHMLRSKLCVPVVATDGPRRWDLGKGCIIIGDGDSLQSKSQQLHASYLTLSPHCRYIKDPCQNTTDSQKVLDYIKKTSQGSILIIGAFGHDYDHQYYNTKILQKFSRKRLILTLMYGKCGWQCGLFLPEGSYDFAPPYQCNISVFPWGRFALRGVRWPVSKCSNISIRNCALGPVHLDVYGSVFVVLG